MKATDHFKRTIQAYLDNRAAEDELFAVYLHFDAVFTISHPLVVLVQAQR